MDRNNMVLEVLKLYDEIELLKSQLEAANVKKEINDASNQESSPVYEMLVMAGIDKMKEDLIENWHFRTYAPKVRNDQEETVLYKDWKSQITSRAFDSDALMKYIGYNTTTFNDVLRILDNALQKFYAKKLLEEPGQD